MGKFSESFKKNVEERIQALENISSIEFVPVFVKRSSDYFWIRLSYACIAAFFFYVLVDILEVTASMPILLRASSSIFFGVVFFVFLGLDKVFTILIPKWVLNQEVQEEALRWFLGEEVFKTRNRTGLLVLISEFEKSVFLLADRGLTEKLGAEVWANLGAKLAEDFSHDSPGDSFVAALQALIESHAADFPAQDKKDEISNQIRGA